MSSAIGAYQAIKHVKDNPDSERIDRSVHGGLSSGNKIFNIFEATKHAATAAGKDMSATLHRNKPPSNSRILTNVSHHHTATHMIPKVRGEVRASCCGVESLPGSVQGNTDKRSPVEATFRS